MIKKTINLIKLGFFSPYLITFVPIIFIYAQNVGQLIFIDTVRIFIAALIIVSLLYWLLIKFTRNKLKASLILSSIIAISFLSGNLTRVIPFFELIHFRSFILSRNPLFLIISIILTLVTVNLILKTKKNLAHLTNFIAYTAIVIIVLNITRIFVYFLVHKTDKTNMPLSSQLLTTTKLTQLPDIYYIIVDGHAREDVLDELFDHTRSPLFDYLRAKEFFIANKSQPNYIYTHLSLATSLNYEYIEKLPINLVPGSKNANLLASLIENNKTARRLKQLGYSYLIFNSGFNFTEKSPIADINYEYIFGFNNFEQSVIKTNIYYILFKYFEFDLVKFHRQQILYTFETLKKIPNDSRPTFTFAHILSPHPPFVFDADGKITGKGRRFTLTDGINSVKTREEYKNGYRDQLIFTDKMIIQTLDEILKKSDPKPIIILQGDHGPASEIDWSGNKKGKFLSEIIDDTSEKSIKERTSILNAYYFPYGGDKQLYETFSPVNSFRILFNYYFGGNFSILPDKTRIDI